MRPRLVPIRHLARSSRSATALLAWLAVCAALAPFACGGGTQDDGVGPPVGPGQGGFSSGGSAGNAGTDASSGGIAGTGGGSDAASPIDAKPETAPDSPVATDSADGAPPAWCLDDMDCVGNPAGKYCDTQTGRCGTCKLTDPSTCQAGFYCDAKTLACVVVCKAGEFGCNCNDVMQCDPGPPAKWVPKSPAVTCDFNAGQACDAKTGTCKTLAVTGTTTPTGTYFQYAVFTPSNSVFKGGCGLDSYNDLIYVNRDGQSLDVYKVTLLDSDGDGVLEPNQHPDNPKAIGPIEQRVLSLVQTYTKAADNVPLGVPWDTEIYLLADRMIYSGPSPNTLTEYVFATKASSVIAVSTTPIAPTTQGLLGYGEKDKLWYAGDDHRRRVYSYCPAGKTWVAEFTYPSLAGDHFDGMEVVVSPKTQVQYVYVSDMQSDYLGQYRRDGSGGWIQENLFKYNDGTGSDVEGMGFGALHHFWAANCGYPVGPSGVNRLYEIGGGDLSEYTD
jgi:hypothetical protein